MRSPSTRNNRVLPGRTEETHGRLLNIEGHYLLVYNAVLEVNLKTVGAAVENRTLLVRIKFWNVTAAFFRAETQCMSDTHQAMDHVHQSGYAMNQPLLQIFR
jgi:hypothetical protein